MDLTRRQVLDRMHQGNLPCLAGAWNYKSSWDDGAIATHKVMKRLFDDGKIVRPEKASLYSPWQLARTPR